MNLENIQKVENLIKERNKILIFKSKTSENAGERSISINDIDFEAVFLRPIYSQEFVKELNTKITSICDEYISMINNQLSEL